MKTNSPLFFLILLASIGLANTITFPQDVLHSRTGSGFVAAWNLYSGVKLNDSGDYILDRSEGFLFQTNWTFERYNGSDWNRINVRSNTVQLQNGLPDNIWLYRNQTVGQSFFNETYNFMLGGGFKLSVYGKTQSAGTFRVKWTFNNLNGVRNESNGTFWFRKNGEDWYMDFSDLLNSGYRLNLERGANTFNVTINLGDLNAGDNFTLDPTITTLPFTIGTQGDVYNMTANITVTTNTQVITYNVSANYSWLNTSPYYINHRVSIVGSNIPVYSLLINSTYGAIGGNGLNNTFWTGGSAATGTQKGQSIWGAFYGDSGRNFSILNSSIWGYDVLQGESSCYASEINNYPRSAFFGFCNGNLTLILNDSFVFTNVTTTSEQACSDECFGFPAPAFLSHYQGTILNISNLTMTFLGIGSSLFINATKNILVYYQNDSSSVLVKTSRFNLTNNATNAAAVTYSSIGFKLASSSYYQVYDSIFNFSYRNGTVFGLFSQTANGNSSLVNTTYDYDNFTITGTGNVSRYWYVNTLVVDVNNNPYSGATVSVFDANGYLIFNGTSNSTGYIPQLNLREWWQNSTGRNVTSSHNFSAWIQNLNLQNSTTDNVSTNLIATGGGEVVIQLGGIAPTPTPIACNGNASSSFTTTCTESFAEGNDRVYQNTTDIWGLGVLLFILGVLGGALFKKKERKEVGVL